MNQKFIKCILNNNKTVFVNVQNFEINRKQPIIISIDKVQYFGIFNGNVVSLDDSKAGYENIKFEKIATKDDIKKNDKNIKDAEKALFNAKKIINELNLNMKLLSAYFTFDRSQLVFLFTSEERVDFRELAKKLASIYKTRIELRQIGVRDKAKEVGGIGPCGRFLCCNLFLSDFESVSINMAKNQFISLKPDKINGICGRLLCCLKYEDDQYTDAKKNIPKLNSNVKYDGVEGKVVAINILKNTIVVEKQDKTLATIELKKYESIK